MPKTFCCKNCGERTTADPRLKGKQKYCGKTTCQNVRKRDWDKAKSKNDSHYHQKRLESKKNWRKRRPGDEYQGVYRETHPEYVEENRKRQVLRNKKRLSTIVSTVINPSALIVQFQEDGAYSVSRVKKRIAIKSDTLAVQIIDRQWSSVK